MVSTQIFKKHVSEDSRMYTLWEGLCSGTDPEFVGSVGFKVDATNFEGEPGVCHGITIDH